MKSPAIRRFRCARSSQRGERGITMVLVALAMVAIIAMAALSIDVVTLYLAREEAQQSADAAALAAARVISISGITGDPANSTSSWQTICGGSTSSATQTAQAVATQNAVGSSVPATVNVTYSAGGTTNADCHTLPAAFGVNPMVTVQIQQTGLPTFFSRIWGRSGNTVSATATAEAFNPSNSATGGNVSGGAITPVQPSCVKPWIVPNLDPLNPGRSGGTYCYLPGGGGHGAPGPCQPFVSTADGSIQNPGISLNGTGNRGVIGENFWLVADCHRSGSSCNLRAPPQANYPPGSSPYVQNPPNLLYVPGQVTTPVTAIPSCTLGDPYEEAIEGCDSPANYSCGVQNSSSSVADLRRNPAGSGATSNGVQCLIQQSNLNDLNNSSGQDYLAGNGFGLNSYPYQITAGTHSALGSKAGLSGIGVSSSPSIVSLPIYDNTAKTIVSNTTTDVTFVGFLQVFINAADQNGNVNVTVLNVAGCGKGNPLPNNSVTGTSPVPIRLVTPP
jgi:Flp pilus assembly protein TadG